MNKKRWANIICDAKMNPTMLIVTDGDWDTRVPISNSRMSTVKRAAHDIYGVPHKQIIVTKILGDVNAKKDSQS